MKVKIGKYPDRLRCNLYSNYMNKRYGFIDWPEKQTRFEKLLERLDDVIQSCFSPINHFLDKRPQKISVKIDRWDTWSMDETLSHIVVPMLKQLKETKHGAPFVDYEDAPEHLRPEDHWYERYSKDGETDPYFFERWDWVMDEMIFAFEQKHTDWESKFYSGDVDRISEPCEDNPKLSTWKKGPNHSFEIDMDGMKAYQARISNGFRLFGKYYESLWD